MKKIRTAEERKAWFAKRYQMGLCRQCGKVRETQRHLCNACTIKGKKYKAKPRPHETLRAWQKQQSEKRKTQIINHYGGKCACCGEGNIWFLTLDHKLSNGNRDPRVFGPSGHRITGLGLYNKLINLGFPDDFQVLCWNCNHAKEIYGGGVRCPHQGGALPSHRIRSRKASQSRETESALIAIFGSE